MKNHDPFDFDSLDRDDAHHRKGLRQIMLDNETYDSKSYSKTRFSFFIMTICLLLFGFGFILFYLF
ncbi:hypothetical protein [Staphylococcus caeli]|uniref:Phage protein n=1 Tax=Staphylococcus caeli TaxID=2201815 RepID=A0A1D4H2T4_9STAP|nr:hypothetical protein [Staphylococcus caeli]SCS31522.1 Uncharacterised protein [Staphylococcus caeli]SCS36008.1 Uncharacterised protein [Staphylococcus caeli]